MSYQGEPGLSAMASMHSRKERLLPAQDGACEATASQMSPARMSHPKSGYPSIFQLAIRAALRRRDLTVGSLLF